MRVFLVSNFDNMKGVKIARYTSWDYRAIWALQQYWFWYDLTKWSDTVVTTLNRVKIFLEKFFLIQQPTSQLVTWILEETSSWEYVWDGIDLNMNICKLFKINIDKFKKWINLLLSEGRLRKEKNISRSWIKK